MQFEDVFAFAKVIAATVVGEARQVVTNLRAIGSGDGDADSETSTDEPLYGSIGFLSRPMPESEDGAAEVIAARAGDYLRPIAGRDLRISKKRGNMKSGAQSIAGYGGAFTNIEPAASGTGDTWQTYVPFAHEDDVPAQAHSFIFDTADGNESIVLLHALGQALILNQEGAAILKSANGQHSVTVRNDGVVLAGLLNFMGGIVAGNSPLAQPVALAPALAALATALQTACAPAGPLQAFVTTTVGPSPLEKTAANAALSAIATAAAAVAAPATGASQVLKASPV